MNNNAPLSRAHCCFFLSTNDIGLLSANEDIFFSEKIVGLLHHKIKSSYIALNGIKNVSKSDLKIKARFVVVIYLKLSYC